jgi:hypothetical protein
MEQLGISCTNEVINLFTFNKKDQKVIGQIKRLTMLMCAHPDIHTTCTFLVGDMEVRNYSNILGCQCQHLTGG